MMALTFEIHALEPLLATQLEGDPNSAVSYPYVPGSVIRGALANRYLPDLDFDLGGDDKGRRLFFDGSTRYLNAYLLDRRGARTLPTPLSWFYEKETGLGDGASVYDFSVEVADYLKGPKGLGRRFWRLFDDKSQDDDDWEFKPVQVEFTCPQWQINVHTARERIKGRATKDEGAVFRYQALAAGERFGGVILVSTPEDAQELGDLLTNGDLWLGGSRSGGYGRVRIENVQRVDVWRETKTRYADLASGDRLVITLLSDTILRHGDRAPHHRNGAYADRLTPDLLPVPFNAVLELESAFKHVTPLGGFNRKWGLPLYQVLALQAGSVFAFDVTGDIAAADLYQLEEKGIGERRVEGFGRVAVNWHKEEELTVKEVTPSLEPPVEVFLGPDSKDLATKMVERLLRRDLDRLLAQHIMSTECKISDPPSKAQISRLRAIALNALPSVDVARLFNFLLDGNLKARAREQYQKARIGGERLLDWLGAVILNTWPTTDAKQLLVLLDSLSDKPTKGHLPELHQEIQIDVKAVTSQLGVAGPNVLPTTDEKQLRNLLSNGDLKKRLLKDYQEAQINGVRLTDLLGERLKRPRPIWRRLHSAKIPLPKIGDVEAELSDLANEYTIRLIEGVLHRATKEQGNE